MVARLNNITFACAEPVELAEFWRRALGNEHIETPPEILAEVEKAIAAGELDPTGWAMLATPTAPGRASPSSGGRRARRPTSPIHLDLHADDRPAEVDRLVGIGAIVVDERSQKIGPHEEFWTVMKDPEGNGFCVS